MATIFKNNLKPFCLPGQVEVGLRLLKQSDFELVKKWLSDPYIIQLTFVVSGPQVEPQLPFSDAMTQQYINALIADKKRKTFAIEVNGKHVGNIGLKEYTPEQGYSEIFIEIGEAECRGKGFGKAAMAILMDYAFSVLRLQEIRLEVLEFNATAIQVYEKIGFIKTGSTGWHYDHHGQYWQVLGMKLTKDRWDVMRNSFLLPANIVTAKLS